MFMEAFFTQNSLFSFITHFDENELSLMFIIFYRERDPRHGHQDVRFKQQNQHLRISILHSNSPQNSHLNSNFPSSFVHSSYSFLSYEFTE